MCVAAAVATGCVWHAFLVTEISDFRRIDGGRCADIFEFDVGRVLKLYDHRFSAEWVGQAAERAQLIVDAGVRVPGIFGIESVGGRFGVVMERIDGETLWERVAQRPGDAAALGADLARLHVEINSIEVGESFVDALGLMAERIAQVSFVEADLVGRAISVIESRSGDRNLLHGDLHPGNVMVRPSGELVAIDWDFPRRGPASHDACRAFHLIGSWALAPGTNCDVIAVRRAMATSYINVYGDAADLGIDDIVSWTLPHAIARFSEGIEEERGELYQQLAEYQL